MLRINDKMLGVLKVFGGDSAKIVYTLHRLNWVCFSIGMIGVWLTTNSIAALGFTFIASLHVAVNLTPEAPHA